MARKKASDQYDYILKYIDKAIIEREALKDIVVRTINAYKGDCMYNAYKSSLAAFATSIDDPAKKAAYDKFCSNIKEKKNMVVFNAVETVVSMAMGGASQFEFASYDKYLEADDILIDKQKAAAEHFYEINKMDALMPQAVRNMATGGAAYLYIKPEKCDDGSFKVSLIDSHRMLLDPLRAKVNRSRFIGFTQMESWQERKKNILKEKSGYVLKSINEVDVYLSQVRNQINGTISAEDSDIAKDISIFYSTDAAKVKESKDDPKKMSDAQYIGDDVEVSYVYDLIADMYFEVVNRKFIVVGKQNPIKRTLQIPYIDSNGENKKRPVTVSVDSPFVEIPYIKTSWEKYPVSPLFYVLEDFDSVCSIETVMYHNLSIMAPINFVGSSYDAEIISKAIQVAGEIIEGTLSQTGVFSKQHDMSAVITALQRYEDRIKRVMGAVDQYELQAMIGNRATASEVSSANGAVSQRLNQLLANIETGMGELTSKFFKMWVIFSDDKTLSFSNNGKYDEASAEELAVNCLVRGKLKSSIKLEQAEQSRNAMQTIGFLGQNEAIDKKRFFGVMIPIAMQGLVNRVTAESFVNEQYRFTANDALVEDKKDDIKEEKGIIDDINMDGIDPQQFQEMLMAAQGGVPGGIDPTTMQGMPQDQTVVQGMPTQASAPIDLSSQQMAPGTSPYDAGALANQAGAMYGG